MFNIETRLIQEKLLPTLLDFLDTSVRLNVVLLGLLGMDSTPHVTIQYGRVPTTEGHRREVFLGV